EPPPAEEKYPPTYNMSPELWRLFTLALVPTMRGFHPVATPVVALTAASSSRSSPPMLLNWPPTYTVEPLTASASTLPSTLGFQAASAPVVMLNAAARFRATPSTSVNVPPAYSIFPPSASAEIE